MPVDDEAYFCEDFLYFPCEVCTEEDKSNCICAELLGFLENLG